MTSGASLTALIESAPIENSAYTATPPVDDRWTRRGAAEGIERGNGNDFHLGEFTTGYDAKVTFDPWIRAGDQLGEMPRRINSDEFKELTLLHRRTSKMISQLKGLKQVCVLFGAGALAIGLAGCKAGEAKSAGFVDESAMTKDPSLPFQRSWKKPGFDKSRYTKVYVAPVNTAYMLRMTEWQEGARKGEFEQDVAKLAVFTQDTIKKAFREDPQHRMQVLDAPTSDPEALVVEVALIEVVPSKVALNALGYAPMGIGMGINAVRMVAKDTSTCAFEARIRDAATKEVVATVADREAQQLAAVSTRGLTWYSNAETIIAQWADQFVKVANRKPGETVKDTEVFTLKPW